MKKNVKKPAASGKQKPAKREFVVEVLRSIDAYDLVHQCVVTSKSIAEVQAWANEIALAFTTQEERDPDEMYAVVTPLNSFLRNMRKSGREMPKFVREMQERV